VIDPTLSELIRRAVESRVADVHVAIPAEVQSYDAAKQTVVAVPLVRNVIEGDTDDLWEEDFPPIPNVPVEWPGGGGMYLHFPLTKGDTGVLTFCERSIAEWRNTGKMATPSDLRLHGLSAAVFRPGLRSNKSARTDVPASGVAVLSVGSGFLRVGEDAGSEFVALGEKVKARLDTLQQAFDGHTHSVATAGSSTAQTGTAAPPDSPIGPLDSVSATKLKVK
jgi:hypothetical protein